MGAKRCKKVCVNILNKIFKTHIVDNAFRKLNIGWNTQGVIKKLPIDSMHCVEHGIVKYINKLFLDPMPDSMLTQVNLLALKLL